MSDILGRTSSVCPTCLQRIPAELFSDNETVTMVKTCPEHGTTCVDVWHGPPSFSHWTRPKIPYGDGFRQTESGHGCPLDCGLCPQHRQRTCTVLVEITSRCNLNCPVCFADSGRKGPEPDIPSLQRRFTDIHAQTGGCNLQLSGGEPTMRHDLPEIINAASSAGFDFIQLNTNGLHFADNRNLAKRLARAGLASAFLQFDGLTAGVWRQLRGRDLSTIKNKAIERLAEAGIGVVLVTTVVKGVNDHQLWQICRYALDNLPAIRGVHLQPLSLMGRYPGILKKHRLSLPEVMRMLVKQSGQVLTLEDFTPPGCEHALCSFSARYLQEEDGKLTRLGKAPSCNCTPQPAETGAHRSISWTARQWASPRQVTSPEKTGNDLHSFLARARTHIFSLSAMAFQDCWTMNLERLQECCIHVADEDGRLIPFCAYNLTGQEGKTLYRRSP